MGGCSPHTETTVGIFFWASKTTPEKKLCWTCQRRASARPEGARMWRARNAARAASNSRPPAAAAPPAKAPASTTGTSARFVILMCRTARTSAARSPKPPTRSRNVKHSGQGQAARLRPHRLRVLLWAALGALAQPTRNGLPSRTWLLNALPLRSEVGVAF